VRFLKKWGRKAANSMGAGAAVAAVGIATGNTGAITLGAQLVAGGGVKRASKAAGREIHRVLSPIAAMGVLGVAQALGADLPVPVGAIADVELAAATAVEVGELGALEFLVNGLLPGAVQSTTKNATKAVRDYTTRRAW
jgi:hypothetical protein